MADTLDSTGKYVPKDLQITAQPDAVDKNKFQVVATNLKIDKPYVFQFQYVFPDGEVSEWSPGYNLLTNTETVPGAPSATVASTGSGVIPVTLTSYPTNAKRVDVFIIGGIFGIGKVAHSFFAAGTYNIPVAAGSYKVVLLTVTPSSINGDPTSEFDITVTDPNASTVITSPEDPFAPTVRAGLASVIVEWSGKKSDGSNLTTTGFDGAKVHIGTSAGFIPSDNNWVHTLNFANGSNRVSIGVGSVIDKSNSTTLQYGVAYYIKLVTVNANGQSSGTVSASNNPVTVAKLPASEISTGILTADASITAGVDGGSRVVLSGGPSPFVIYGTNGTTKLLEFIGGATGTLSITGGGTFTGDISAATGTLKNALNIGTYDLATWGGRGYPFSVNSSGNVEAGSGKIGGWTIDSQQLVSSTSNSGQIKLFPNTANGGKIALVYQGVEKITIDPVEGIVGPNNGSTFKLTPSGQLTLSGSITVTGGQLQSDLNTINGNVTTATNKANDAQSTANSKNRTFYLANSGINTPTPAPSPAPTSGDIWFDITNQNKQYRYDGSSWTSVQDGTIVLAKNAADAAKAKADTSLQQGGNEVRNGSNQITTINSSGITITGSTFSLNGAETSTTPSANSLVINSQGVTAQNASGQTTFYINASTGDAEFKGIIKSGSTITGAQIQTATDSFLGSIRLNSSGSKIEILGSDGSVYGQLYQFSNGNEIILRHGSSDYFGYPTSSAYLSLNPYTTSLGYSDVNGNSSYGLDITSGGDNRFTGDVQGFPTNGGANTVGNTLRYFRNTVITNTTPSGSGFYIGDIWIQY